MSDSGLLVLNSALGAIGGTIFWILASRNFSAADMGVITTLVGVILVTSTFSVLGMSESLKTFIPSERRQYGVRILDFVISLSVSLSIILALIICIPIWNGYYLGGISENKIVCILIIASIPVVSCISVFSSYLVSINRVIWTPISTFISQGICISALLIFSSSFSEYQNASGLLFSWLAGLVVSLTILFSVTIKSYPEGKKPSFSVSGEIYRKIRRLSLANLLLGSRLSLILAIGSVIILERWGPSSAAEFFILWRFSNLASTVPYSLSSISLVRRGHYSGENVFSGAIPALISTISAILFTLLLVFLTPFFGNLFVDINFFELLPWGASIIPSHLLMMNIGDWRYTSSTKPMYYTAFGVVALFSCTLFLARDPSEIGWFWFATLVVVSLLGAFQRGILRYHGESNQLL